MQKITPFLWFNSNAEEAMNFYVSVFKNSKVGSVTRGPNGTVLGKLLHDKDAEKAQRVMSAMLQMDKIDIKRLQQAYDRG